MHGFRWKPFFLEEGVKLSHNIAWYLNDMYALLDAPDGSHLPFSFAPFR